MGWVKFKVEQPEENKEVLVRFNNGTEINGKRNGNFMLYNPKDIKYDDHVSGAKEWLKI